MTIIYQSVQRSSGHVQVNKFTVFTAYGSFWWWGGGREEGGCCSSLCRLVSTCYSSQTGSCCFIYKAIKYNSRLDFQNVHIVLECKYN